MSILYFVDTETTGLDPNKHTILEFCCVKMIDRVEVDRLVLKIIPTQQDLLIAAPEALKINQFNLQIWKDEGVDQKTAAIKIASFLVGSKQSAMIAHNARFDIAHLKSLMKKTKTDHRLPYRCIDTIAASFARFEPLGLRSFKMDSIRSFLGWSDHGVHTAEKDVEDLIRLWDILSPKPIEETLICVKELIVTKRIKSCIQ